MVTTGTVEPMELKALRFSFAFRWAIYGMNFIEKCEKLDNFQLKIFSIFHKLLNENCQLLSTKVGFCTTSV